MTFMDILIVFIIFQTDWFIKLILIKKTKTILFKKKTYGEKIIYRLSRCERYLKEFCLIMHLMMYKM